MTEAIMRKLFATVAEHMINMYETAEACHNNVYCSRSHVISVYMIVGITPYTCL